MITDVSWRGDSNVLASASEDGNVRLWGAEEGNSIKSFGAHGGGVQDVDYSHDGNLATTGRDKQIKWWDGEGKAIKQFPGFADIGLQVGVVHDDKAVVAGDWTGIVNIYELDGKVRTSFNTNPLALNDRVAEVGKRVADAEAQAKQANDAFAGATKRVADLTAQLQATKANAEKTMKDFNDTKQLIPTLAAEQKNVQAEQQKAKATLNQQTSAKKNVDKAVVDKGNALKQAEGKLKQAQDAAAKDAKNAQLAEAVKANEASVAKAKAELEAATKMVTDIAASLKSAEDTLKALDAKLNTTKTQLSDAQKRLPELQKQIKPTTEAIPAVQKQLDDANTKVAPTKAIAEQKAAAAKQLQELHQKMQAVAATAKK